MASRSLGTLTLDLIARIGGFQEGMNRASRSVASTGAAADAASARINALQSQFLSLSSIASRIAGPLAAAFSVSAVYSATEAYSTLTNRLKLVTDNSTELAAAQRAVFGIAQESAQPLLATAELYQRIATNQDALKLSGEGVAGIVGTISKTLAVSGSSAESANAALIQLGQAFASGVLRGEELNSVMEQAPALAQAIAAGMGKTVGELRAMGAAGELTADAVVKALQSQAGAVDELFAKTATTIGNSFTKISNSMTRFIGELDQATGASSRVSAEFVGLSSAIDNSLPAAMEAVTKNSEVLSQVLTTGLYVALGRVAGGYAALVPAYVARAKSAAEEARANQVAAATATRKAEVDLVSAKNAVQQAALNRRLAATVAEVTLAENALSAAKVKALLLSERLGVARAAEASANALVTSTSTAAGLASTLLSRSLQATLGAGRALLALMGGPVGLLFITGAVALSFVDFRSSSDKAKEGLEQLKGPMDDVIARFKAMTEEQRAGALVRWGEAQAEAVKAAKGELDSLQATLKKGVLGSDSLALPSRIAGSSNDQTIQRAKAYKELSDRIQEAAKNGRSIVPILEEAGRLPGVSPTLVNELKKIAEAWSTQDQVAKEAEDRQKTLRGQFVSTTSATVENTAAVTGLTAAGQKYLQTIQQKLGKLQDNNDAVKEANRFIAEHKELTEADRVAILSAAHASKAQDEANKTVTASTKSHASEMKALLKTFKTAEDGYQRQIELINTEMDKRKAATELEKLAFELSSGKYEALNSKQRERLEGLAAELDVRKKLKQANEDDKVVTEFKGSVDRQLSIDQRALDAPLLNAWDTDEVKQRYLEMLAIEQDFQDQMEDLRLRHEVKDISDSVYERETEILANALNDRLAMQEKYHRNVDKLQQNGTAGLVSGFASQAEASMDLYSNMQNVGADTFSNLTDAMTEWAETGKLDAKGLASTFIQSVGHALLSYAAAQVAMAGLSAFTAMIGVPFVGPAIAPGAAIAATAAAGVLMTGVGASLDGQAHAGINNIPREGTWLLDGGERVLSPNQNQDLTNFLSDKGRHSGGLAAGAAPDRGIKVINNGPPVSARTELSGGELKLILDAAEDRIANGFTRGTGKVSRAAGAAYGMRRDPK